MTTLRSNPSILVLFVALSGCGFPAAPTEELPPPADDSSDSGEPELPDGDLSDDDDATDAIEPTDDDDVLDPPEDATLPPLGARRCDGLPVMATADPTLDGPFDVGVRTITLTDPLREGRTLTTEIWYPSDGTSGPGVGYGVGLADLLGLAGGDLGGIAALLALGGGGDDLITIVETSAVRDAPPADADPARGLVLFSHGFRGARYQSTFLTVRLASHGYVVVAPDHLGNTMFDGSEEATSSAISRIVDLHFLMDALTDLVNDPADPLYAAFAPERIATVGHSFGASTALSGGVMDNREMVAIPLAPAFDDRMSAVWNPESYDLRAAVAIVGGSADGSTPFEGQQMAYDHTVAPRFLTELDGARHFDFTDLCGNDLLRFALTSFVDELSDACGDDPTAYHATVQTHVTSVLGRYLACDPGADAWLAPGFVEGLDGVGSYQADPAGPIAGSEPVLDQTPLVPEAAPSDEWFIDDPLGRTAWAARYASESAAPAPTLVLVHDSLTDGRLFSAQVDALSGALPVLVVDLPGSGRAGVLSEDPMGADGAPGTGDEPLSELASAGALAAVLEEVGAGPYVVVGSGRGGRVALRLAGSEATDEIDLAGLALVGTAPMTWPAWLGHPDYNGGATLQWLAATGRARVDSDPATWSALAPALLRSDASPTLVATVDQVVSELPTSTRQGLAAAADAPLLDAVSAVDLPVLLLHGECDDNTLLESSQWLDEALSDAQLVILQRSGHLPYVEQPEAFAYELAAFALGL